MGRLMKQKFEPGPPMTSGNMRVLEDAAATIAIGKPYCA
jgi:hypothetical protein